MARILITGGGGFIGSHLVSYHLNKGDDVWAIDNFLTGKIENIAPFNSNPKFRFSDLDLSEASLNEPVKWADSIYHLASVVGYPLVLKCPIETLWTNIHCCENVLQTVADVNPKAKVLIASSSEVYGTQQDHLLSEDMPVCFSHQGSIQKNYALSKYVSESTAFSYITEKKLYCVIARIFNTVGLRQSSAGLYYVIPNFIDKALKGKPLTIFGTGRQTRSFCSVHDTVRMLDIFLGKNDLNGEIINIGNDEEISMIDLAHLVCKIAKSDSEIVYVPYKEVYQFEFNDTLRRCPDLTKMMRILGYHPTYSIEKTLSELIQHLRG